MIRHFTRALALLALAAGPAALSAEPCKLGLPPYKPAQLKFPTGAGYVTPDGRIRIVGYDDMAEMLTSLAAIFEKAHPGFRFELILKGTRTAVPPLTHGTSLFAPMGAELEDPARAYYRAAHGRDPLEIKVAHDSLNPRAQSSPVGIFVHKDNPMTAITLEQIREIFTANRTGEQATEWGDVGLIGAWRKLDIHPVGFADYTAIANFLVRHKFEGHPFVKGYVGKAKSRGVIAAVAGDPRAIGIANLAHATPDVKALGVSDGTGKVSFGSAEDIRAGRYPLDRHLLMLARLSPDGAIDPVAREWYELILSCEGQQVIAAGERGYIPLNPAELAAERAKLPSRKGASDSAG